MNITSHFQTRAQQRAFSPDVIEMILGLGQANAKGDLILLGKKEIDQALGNLKEVARELTKMRSHGGAGIALEGDTLITCFHRHKKFKR